MAAERKAMDLLMYKGRPLVKQDKTIYYGNMSEKYVAMIQIVDTSEKKGMTLPSKLLIQLALTDPEIRMRDKIVKKTEKTSLYDAIEIAAIWLERALKQ